MADTETTPPISKSDTYKLGWLNNAYMGARKELEDLPGYKDIDRSIAAVNGSLASKSRSISQTSVNYIRKVFFDTAAMLSDTRPFWEYQSRNAKFERHAKNFNLLAESWYLNQFVDQRIMDVIKYMEVGGSGYATMTYDRRLDDIIVFPDDPRDVVPFMPSDNFSIQNCQGVFIPRQRPVAWLKAQYPEKASKIKASSVSNSSSSGSDRAAFWNVLASMPTMQAQELFQASVKNKIGAVETAIEIHFFFKDGSRNETNYAQIIGPATPEGEPDTDWAYRVEPGEFKYPRGRYICFTESAVLFDGPNPYLHGLFPTTKFCMDPVPWSLLGVGVIWSLLDPQASLDQVIRSIEDSIEKSVGPDFLSDKNSIARSLLNKIDSRASGQKIEYNPLSGRPPEYAVPPQLSGAALPYRDWLIQTIRELSGTQDLSALTKLGQLPSTETVDKMIEAATPLIRARSRALEVSFREFAMQFAYNSAQFYTSRRRLQILGPDRATLDDLDMDPDTLVPAFVDPDDYTDNGQLHPLAQHSEPKYRRGERIQRFMKNFTFHVKPGSLLNAASITRRLEATMLSRAGLLDMWTLGEIMEIPNMGQPPDPSAQSITDRLILQNMLGLGPNVSAAGRKSGSGENPQPPTFSSAGGISQSG